MHSMTFLRHLKKGQAAMEFLMTYGWAILVVLIVIGALVYFGVLSPSTLLPEKCTFPVSLSCLDHSVTPTYVAVSLRNGAGRDMIIREVTVTGDALTNGGACRTTNVLATGLPGSVNIPPLITDFCPASLAIGTDGCTSGSLFRNGATNTITMRTSHSGVSGCTFNANIGREKNKYNVTVFYSWADSTAILHSLSGELLARRPS